MTPERRKNRALGGAGLVLFYGALILAAVWLGCSRDTTPPSSPYELNSTTAFGDNTPTFAWDAAVDDGSGVAHYLVRIDEGSWTKLGKVTTCDWGSPLSDGSHRLEVKAVDKHGNGGVSASLAVLVDTAAPPSPSLKSPVNSYRTNDTTPSFAWGSVSDASGVTYRLQIDEDAGFSSPCVNMYGAAKSEYTLTEHLALVDGDYYWRVCAVDGAGQESEWTGGRSLTVDTVVPLAPTPVYPANGKETTDNTPWLDWTDVTDPSGVRYELQADDNADFSSPVVSRTGVDLSSTTSSALQVGMYYWRVRTVDGAGNESAWSSAWTFTVVAP